MSIGSEASGNSAMVVAGHPLAVEAGLTILDRGGSATDAVIASAAALCVVLPQAVTLGGDAFGLFYDAADRTVHGLNASGRSPRDARTSALTSGEIEAGVRSVTVPALVRGWELAHARLGRVAWRQLFEPAIGLAERGVPISRVLARALQSKLRFVEADPDLAALLVPEGRPLAAGDTLRQPQMANTLRAVAEDGARAFYEGPIARSLVARLRRDGGLLDDEDFARCTADWTLPLTTPYRGYDAVTAPPNSFGILGLLQLQHIAASGVDLARATEAKRIKLLVEAAEIAFERAAPFIADPAALEASPEQLLVSTEPAPAVGAATRHPAGTAVTMAVDSDGNAAVLVESIFTLFGSGVLDPATGILLNNRMRAFSLDPASPNRLAPSKRPAHTLSPMMLLEDGALRMVLGSPGALGQTVTLVQAITNHLDRGMAMPSAIAAPRWSYDIDRRVILEEALSNEVDAKLKAASIEADRPSGDTPYFGSVKAIAVGADGRLAGFADRRRDGAAGGR